jgi:GntR family transcriptional regulator
MPVEWNDNQPIYRQLRELVVARILDGSFSEGEPLPSVRQVAADYSINHLTVAKAYQELVDENLVEKKRGLGMYVITGARQLLSDNEQHKFLEEELPAFARRVVVLGLDMDQVASKLRQTDGERA